MRKEDILAKQYIPDGAIPWGLLTAPRPLGHPNCWSPMSTELLDFFFYAHSANCAKEHSASVKFK